MKPVDMWGRSALRLMMVGLTGGIASGKSEVAAELVRLGARVIDADVVAREVVLPGAPVYERLVEEYGQGILGGDGTIDRQALAREAFADEGRRLLLNSITHPAIFRGISGQVDEYADKLASGDVPAVVVDAALIVDVGVTGVFDALVVVTAEKRLRLGRMVETRGMGAAEALERIENQVPDEARLAMADYVIENNGTLDELRMRVAEVWSELGKAARARHS